MGYGPLQRRRAGCTTVAVNLLRAPSLLYAPPSGLRPPSRFRNSMKTIAKGAGARGGPFRSRANQPEPGYFSSSAIIGAQFSGSSCSASEAKRF